jgi:hypothetical protein
MVHQLGVDESVSLELCILLYKQYGTTMAGLRVRTLLLINFYLHRYENEIEQTCTKHLVICIYSRLLATSLITIISTGRLGTLPKLPSLFCCLTPPVISTHLFSASALFMEGWPTTRSSPIHCLGTFCSAYPYAKLYVPKTQHLFLLFLWHRREG